MWTPTALSAGLPCQSYREEGEKEMYLVNVDVDKCTGCGECVDVCPNDVLEVVDGTCEAVGDDCLGCESCVEVCTQEAIAVQEL